MNRLLFLFLLLPVKSLYAQTDASKDSLLKVLSLAKEDTNKVLALITTGQYVEYNNLEEAKNYYLQARRLSEKMNYTLGILKYYSNYTAVLNIQAKFDSALVLTKDALQLANRFGNEERIIIAQQNLSATYSYLQDYESALQYLLPSVAYFEKTKNDARLSLIYDNLGVIYRETKQYDKALEFHQKALAIARKSGNSYDIANVLSNLGNAYSSSKRYDSALVIMQDGLGIARKENYDNIESNIISNIGAVLIKQGRYDSLTYYCTLGLRLAEKLGDSLAMVNNIYGLALYSFFTSDFTKSGELAKTGFRMAQQRNYVEPSQLFADILSELSLVKGDLRNYDYYNRLSIELSEQFFNDRMQRNVQLLDKKYDTEKKEKLLVIQQATILRKNTLNYILIGSAVT
ncbi:MAG: tetratricopeptide repeat protein, partial [Chitinophagaceae bacterium]